MLYTFDLSHYLTYPFKGREAQKSFLIGSLLVLAGFIIPILPFFIIYGYLSQIMQKILDGEKASMPAWDNWEKLFKDGLRLYGVRLIFTIPIMILVFGLMILYFGGLFLVLMQDQPSTSLIAGLILVFLCVICLLFPLGLITSLLSYPAGSHTVAKQSFLAGFSFGEWWPILRKNLGGFLLTIGITYVISFLTNILFQLLYITIILACLLPFLMPAILFYMLLVIEPMATQAYREGRAKLNPPAVSGPPSEPGAGINSEAPAWYH
jgi:hypothetical protein